MKYEETEINNLVLAKVLRKSNFVVLKCVNSDHRVKPVVVVKYLWVGGSGQ